VIWRYMPDAATASAALAAGEIDWWEIPPIDFVPKIEQTASLTTFLPDPLGTQGWLRPNHLHPPFNNKKARQALVAMMNQEMYLQAAIGVPKYYRTCSSVFACAGRTPARPAPRGSPSRTSSVRGSSSRSRATTVAR